MVLFLALQLCPFGIMVNNIAPGIINTDRNAVVLSDPAYRDACLAQVPMSRFGEPEECAGALVLLCSEEGGYITGQDLFVDGGMGIE